MSGRILIAILVLTGLTGCATTQSGVVGQLPEPLVNTRKPKPTALVAAPKPRRVPKADWSMPYGRGWVPRGGIQNRWDYIVIHHSGTDAGNAAQIDKHHRSVNRWDELGYHFVIGNGSRSGDGLVEVGSRWQKQKVGAHCKTHGNTYNEHGIGICLVGNFENDRPTDAQMRSLVGLVRFLMNQCAVRPENVVTHGGVTGRTECPGDNFPWRRFHRSISRSASASVMR